MAEDMVVFQRPEDLCKWLEIKKSDVVLENMRHQYFSIIWEDMIISSDLMEISCCVDIAEGKGEIVPYSIDEIIDIVCEWNYELIQRRLMEWRIQRILLIFVIIRISMIL